MPRSTQKAGAESAAPVTTPFNQDQVKRRRLKAKGGTGKVPSIRDRVAASQAKNNPVQTRHAGGLEAADEAMPKGTPRTLQDPSKFRPSGLIDLVEGPKAMDHAKTLAFMEEIVTVVVHATSDKNADPFPMVGVNGRSQYFIRGQEQEVKRKYVERLARARIRTVNQEYYVDGTGANAIRYTPVFSPAYPFAVVRDDNPKGRDWLKNILEQPDS